LIILRIKYPLIFEFESKAVCHEYHTQNIYAEMLTMRMFMDE